jgi:hypothetical protein
MVRLHLDHLRTRELVAQHQYDRPVRFHKSERITAQAPVSFALSPICVFFYHFGTQYEQRTGRAWRKRNKCLQIIATTVIAFSLLQTACATNGDGQKPAAPTPPVEAGLSNPLFQQPYVDIDEWRNAPDLLSPVEFVPLRAVDASRGIWP